MKIAIACDHAGYNLKEEVKLLLQDQGHEDLDFGTGSIDPSCTNCTMNSEGYENAPCCQSAWATAPTDGLALVNIGNNDVNLTLRVGRNATVLLGGNENTNSYQIKVSGSATTCSAGVFTALNCE